MAKVIPFKGILPPKNLADKIVTMSADNYSYEDAKKIVESNQLSYLSIIYPDFIDHQKTQAHSLQRFQKIYNRFQWFRKNQYFVQDTKPQFYIYKQKHLNFEFNGIIGAISAEDYFKGNIKIHEQTLSEREKKLKEYLKHCRINAEPVLFFYPDSKTITDIILNIQQNSPDIVVNINNIQHFIWKSNDVLINANIQNYFEKTGYVFIADGHHRSASSSLLAKEEQDNIHAQFFLGAFFQESQLKIYSFHRLLKNVVVPDDFVEKISKNFIVEEIQSDYDLKNHILGMYWKNKRYLLKYKNVDDSSIDTDILYQYILKKIFLIEDVRNNPCVDYYSEYIYSRLQAEEMVKKGDYTLAFFTHPVSTTTIKNIALQSNTMPPKSTYVLPKLLNGLVVYSLDESIVLKQ